MTLKKFLAFVIRRDVALLIGIEAIIVITLLLAAPPLWGFAVRLVLASAAWLVSWWGCWRKAVMRRNRMKGQAKQ